MKDDTDRQTTEESAGIPDFREIFLLFQSLWLDFPEEL